MPATSRKTTILSKVMYRGRQKSASQVWVAYHFDRNLLRAFSQPGKHSFGDPCMQSVVWKGRRDIGKRACVHSASANTPLSSTPPSWHLKFSGKSSDRLPLPSFLPSFLPLFLFVSTAASLLSLSRVRSFNQATAASLSFSPSLPPSLSLSLPLALLGASAATAHSLSHPLEKVDVDNNTSTPTPRLISF